MTVTLEKTEWVGPSRRRVRWSSSESDPTFQVFVNGVLYAETKVNHITVGPADVVEVRDDSAAGQVADEGTAVLGWAQVSNAASYRVEQYVGGQWVRRATIPASPGKQQQWRTPVLEEGSAHQFRVTPIGTNGNAGTPATTPVTVVKHPAAPVVSYSFNDTTKKVTVSAA